MTARTTEPYWHREGEAGRYTFDADAPFGLPYRPTPFYVQVTLTFAGGEEVINGLPVQYRYQGDVFSGEKRSDLLVVPALSVRVITGDCHSACLFRPCVGARAGHAAGRWLWTGGAPLRRRRRPGCGAGSGVRCTRPRARPARNPRHRDQRREGGSRRVS